MKSSRNVSTEQERKIQQKMDEGRCEWNKRNNFVFRPYLLWHSLIKMMVSDFPAGPVDKNLSANAGDMGLIPSQGTFHVQRSN